MESSRRAVIDVGTNSVKLLVADVIGRTVVPVLETSEQTRLGEGFFATRLLGAEAIHRTASAVAAFVVTAASQKATHVRVIATSAARDALNVEQLREAIATACRLDMEVISGEQEAQWAFTGVTSDPALHGLPLLIVDVGGGSTEFIAGDAARQHLRVSFPLGTVRLLERRQISDPPLEEDWKDCQQYLQNEFQRTIHPVVQPALNLLAENIVQLVGTGGSSTLLARMQLGTNAFDRNAIEAVRLTVAEVRQWRLRLWGQTLAERRAIPGLPPNRADVILAGVAIYEVLMQELGIPVLRVSTRGLRFAAVTNACP